MAPRCLLYYITDRRQFSGDEGSQRKNLFSKVAEAARAGVDYIQLREKDLSTRALEHLARKIVDIVHETSDLTRVLINSRTDVALAAGSDGVHLRSEDVTAQEVKAIWRESGTNMAASDAPPIIAVSCHSPEDAARVASEGAHFAVLAPIFGKTKAPGVQCLGLDGVRNATQLKIPVIALGGITLRNAESCLDAGAAGIAGIRLFQQNNIEDVVRTLRRL